MFYIERSEFPYQHLLIDPFYPVWGNSDHRNDALSISNGTFPTTHVSERFFRKQIEDNFFARACHLDFGLSPFMAKPQKVKDI